jgi:hypothetical protein
MGTANESYVLINVQRKFSAANIVVVFRKLLWEMEMFP